MNTGLVINLQGKLIPLYTIIIIIITVVIVVTIVILVAVIVVAVVVIKTLPEVLSVLVNLMCDWKFIVSDCPHEKSFRDYVKLF